MKPAVVTRARSASFSALVPERNHHRLARMAAALDGHMLAADRLAARAEASDELAATTAAGASRTSPVARRASSRGRVQRPAGALTGRAKQTRLEPAVELSLVVQERQAATAGAERALRPTGRASGGNWVRHARRVAQRPRVSSVELESCSQNAGHLCFRTRRPYLVALCSGSMVTGRRSALPFAPLTSRWRLEAVMGRAK